MFDRILIANRGEIAVRVITTARRMGIRAVAVYSDADAGAAHVRMADAAVRIGGPAPADSYLRGDAIIAAALATGAEAVHPGYGFLSESPDFAEAVEKAGLVFIGPRPETIRRMGMKDEAKRLVAAAGVPVVPGVHDAGQDPGALAQAAAALGWPVLVKAVAGGGGRGMREVHRPEDFAAALASARREARGAFGDDAVMIEKLIERPRHVEVQVFGDGRRAIHLMERDCSLQRRHQKVIEEAPAPGLGAGLRDAMGGAAVRAAEAVDYRGAGTVEFLVESGSGNSPPQFWFIEMNTRLQVEHGVTEAILGLDLVEWQLRVAAGESLPLGHSDLHPSGHAVEARIYAEDVPAGFLPVTGTLSHLRFPGNVRVDTAARSGDRIGGDYDGLVAKIVAHGPTRKAALGRLETALEATEVAGLTTNLAFLGALCRHPDVVRGAVDTGLIARVSDTLIRAPEPAPRHIAQAALVALGLWSAPARDRGFALWHRAERGVALRTGGRTVEPQVLIPDWRRMVVETGAATVEARWRDGEWLLDGEAGARWFRDGRAIRLFARCGLDFEVVDPLDRADRSPRESGEVRAPIPGMLRAVHVAAGDPVRAGEALAVLEAMKMEYTLTAGRDGVVEAVHVAAGTRVDVGDLLVRLEDEPG